METSEEAMKDMSSEGDALWRPEPVRAGDFHKPLYSILDEAAQEYPDRTYTILAGAQRTFARVKDAADRVARFLASQGIGPGDRVGIFLPNLPHYPEIFFGILKAGAVCVTCNPMYKTSELNFQLKDSGAKAVFVLSHPVFYPSAVKALEGTSAETVVVCTVKSYLPPIKALVGSLFGKIPKAGRHDPTHIMFDDIMAKFPPDPPALEPDAQKDVALILYTGGTTGIPKGACLTHANLLYNVLAMDEWIRIPGEGDAAPSKMERGGAHTFLGVLPWYHSFGLTLSMLLSCLTASRLVCIPDPRAGKPPFAEVLKAVERNGVTLIAAVPTIYSAMVHHPLIRKFDLSSIIGCGSGGAPLPLEVIKQFEEITGAIVFEGYGLTETSPVLTMNPTVPEHRKIGSVGLPIPGTDLRILDLESGTKTLNRGEDGEIAVSGPQVMLGYWNNPEADDTVFRNIDGKRFFLTGDIGHLDEKGFLTITDRKKDLIIVGGFNVYPREIEEILFRHPKVALAAAIGMPHPHTGEAVKAFIQLKPGTEATEEEFIEFCKEEMAGYKRPHQIEFRESLPTSLIGKVLRKVLRDEELSGKKSS